MSELLMLENASGGRGEFGGVYAIVNLANNKEYIGASGRVGWRIREHLTALRRNDHHNKRLQEDWDCFGESAFRWMVIERLPPSVLESAVDRFSSLHLAEARYISLQQPDYNIRVSMVWSKFAPQITQSREERAG